MIVLPPALRETVHKVGAGKPYAWLFSIAADEDYANEAGTAFYLTSYDQGVTYANLFDLPVADRTYQPIGLRVSTITVDTSANTPALNVAVSNVFREASFRMETGKGFLACETRFVVVNVDQLADGAILGGQGRTRGAVVNGTTANFSIELYGLTSLTVPRQVFIVDRCRYLYGDEQCGFPLDLVTGSHPAEYLKCNKTYSDCFERGQFESRSTGHPSGGLDRPRKHPMRFGGFLGLPRLARR